MSGDAPQTGGGAAVPMQALESLLQELSETKTPVAASRKPAAHSSVPANAVMPGDHERRRTSLTSLPSAARRNSLTPLPSQSSAGAATNTNTNTVAPTATRATTTTTGTNAASVAEKGTAALTNFSTYGTLINEADLVPASQHGPTRLGVRLSPLSPSKLRQASAKPSEITTTTTTTTGGETITTTTATAAAATVGGGNVKSATKLTSKVTSLAKPTSPAGTSTKAARPPAVAAAGKPSPRVLRATSANSNGATTAVLPPLTPANHATSEGKGAGHDKTTCAEKNEGGSDERDYIVPPPECNFLPIMCARYLRPGGLTPSARWGHTLTPMRATRPVSLLLFGGRERDGAETNTLMSYDTEQVAWEPVHIARGRPPAARYYHAACAAYDGRWLLIHGGAARADSTLFADLHCFDVVTGGWKCIWPGTASGQDKNVPCARFAHTMLVREDKLYIYGGKIAHHREHSASGGGGGNKKSGKAAAFTLANNDVYVFSLNTFTWQKRLRAGRKSRAEKETEGNATAVLSPAPRAHHAACVQGSLMFVHGGVGADGQTLTDTWQLQLRTGQWHCLHDGTTADAIPREKHALFACGEGLLVVGGCGSSTVYTERLSSQFSSFVAVLPRVGTKEDARTDKAETSDAVHQEEEGGKDARMMVGAEPKAYWIPVAMGNLSIVAPNRRGFAAAMQDGFVYVFGGTAGAEPATNGLVRFLAADGVVSSSSSSCSSSSATSHAAQSNNEDDGQRLRAMMQAMRSRSLVPYDVYAAASVWTGGPAAATTSAAGSEAVLQTHQQQQSSPDAIALRATSLGRDAEGSNNNGGNSRHGIGLHKAIVQARAPKLWAALQACRSEPCGSNARAGEEEGLRGSKEAGKADSDALDQLMHAVLPTVEQSGEEYNSSSNNNNNNNTTNKAGQEKGSNASAAATGGNEAGPRVYYTHGTSRLPGLPHALGADELSCLMDYVYWAGLPAAFRLLLREDEDDDGGEGEDEDGEKEGEGKGCREGRTDAGKGPRRGSGGKAAKDSAEDIAAVVNTSRLEREKTLQRILRALSEAAADYELPELGLLCHTLLTYPTRRAVAVAQAGARTRLVADMQALCRSGANATMTVLFVDPHTKAQQVRVLHPCIAAHASSFFADLLRPLYISEKATVAARRGIVAKVASGGGGSALLQATSRRAIVVGPMPIPLVAVEPMMRFLYTQQLRVPREAALVTMLGAHELSLHALQQFCEASVAREEVNYESCCSLYYLACKHGAAFLEEIALLTAVSGYATVRRSNAFQHLPADEKERIERVVHELGTDSWQPPPQPMHEMKSSTEYSARWAASALPSL